MSATVSEPLTVAEYRRRAVLAVAGWTALATASVALFLVSRGKWSDAVIDSGTEWLYPDALARGDLLYRDVVYWFGPFTPYFHALFFRLFGSSFATLVLAGVVGSVAVAAALYVALRRVTGRIEAALWTAFAVPVLVFMPNAGGSILGMGYRIWHPAGFSLLALSWASRAPTRRSAALAGACCGLAALCRVEWGAMALLSCVAAAAVQGWREPEARGAIVRMAGAALLVFGVVIGFFLVTAGPKAVLADAPVLLANLPAETRENVVFAGLRGWKEGIPTLVYSAALWGGLFLVAASAVALRGERRAERRTWALRLVATFLVLGALALLRVGTGGGLVFSVAPAVSAVGLGLGILRRGGAGSAALAGFGLLGLLASHRRFFHISDAPYVAPPLLFAIVCAAGLLHVVVAKQPDETTRESLRRSFLVALVLLVVSAFVVRAVAYRQDDRVPIPGTEGMLSARRELVREMVAAAGQIRDRTSPEEGLVVLPEGGVLNYLAGRRNPGRHKLYIPGYVSAANEEEVLADLRHAAPAAVVIFDRSVGEYGTGPFGVGYARRIGAWIRESYRPVEPAPSTRGRPALECFRRR